MINVHTYIYIHGIATYVSRLVRAVAFESSMLVGVKCVYWLLCVYAMSKQRNFLNPYLSYVEQTHVLFSFVANYVHGVNEQVHEMTQTNRHYT
jgi:hypothetical protein